MDIHIGRLIEERINEVGMSKAEFGRRINTSRQNVNTLLRKSSLDTVMLSNISKVLNYDFFKYYVNSGRDAKKDGEDGKGPSVKLVIELPKALQKELLNVVFEEGGVNFKDWI